MNDKIQDMLQFIKKKIRRKKDDADIDSEAEAIGEAVEGEKQESEAARDMVRGDHGKIMGVDRKIVKGLAVVVGLIFVFALMFNLGKGDDKQDKNAATQQEKKQEIAGSQSLQAGDQELSDDYGDLARANQERLQKNGKNASNSDTVQAQRVSTSGGNPTSAPRSSSTLPAVPSHGTVNVTPAVPATPASYGTVYSLPSMASGDDEGSGGSSSPAASSSAPANIVQKAEDKVKDAWASAIAFFGGDSGSGTTATASSEPASAPAASNGDDSSNYSAPSPTTVTAGTIIPSMLLTGINTDTPGQVVAQTLSDVYSLDGSNILIPAGSRVLGSVGSADGSSGRVGVTFSQLVLPDGGTYNIGDSLVAVDGAGYTGLQGNLHRHTGSNFMKGLFNSALTALSTASVDRVTLDASAFDAATETQKPTTTVDPGYTFNVYVSKNLAF